MGTDAVPAGASRLDHLGAVLPLLARAGLALVSFWALSLAADRREAFFLEAAAARRYPAGGWLSWVGAYVATGLLFGLACWLSFEKIRFLPSRLLLAAAALLPVAHFWWLFVEGHLSGGWLGRLYWFDAPHIQDVLAALAGVAIASGFQAKRSRPAPDAEALPIMTP